MPQSCAVRLVSLCLCGLSSASAARALAQLALRSAAASAAGARRVVPAVSGADAAQRPAGRRRAAPRAAGGQHAAADSRGRIVGPERQARAGAAGGVAPRSGHDDEVGAGAERRDRFHRRRDGHGRRHRPQLPEHGRDEGQLRRRPAHAVRHGAPSGVRAGRRSIGSASRFCPACRSASRIPTTSPTPCSIAWSTGSIRTACRRPARRRASAGSRATTSWRSTRSISRRTTPSSPSSAT